MPITVVCPQGHKLTAGEKLAGKSVKCPKCSAVVQIPAVGAPTSDKHSPQERPAAKSSPRSAGPASTSIASPKSPLSNDPAGLVDPLAPLDSFGGNLDSGFDPLFGADSSGGQMPFGDLSQFDLGANSGTNLAAPSPKLGAPIHQPREVAAQPSGQNENWLANISPWAWVGAGGGACFGLLLTAIVGWLLLSGRGQSGAVAVAAPIPAPAGAAPSVPDVRAVAPAAAPVAPITEQHREPAVPASATTPPSAVAPRAPYELVPLQLDSRLDGYALPGITWAAAYDEPSGRLAVTNDTAGILIYDLDDLQQGKRTPVATIATPGLPTAVCRKPIANRNIFVIAGKDQPRIQLVDAETLESLGEVTLPSPRCVDYLSGSLNPEDPYVYYTGARNEKENREEFFGRINLVTKQSVEPPARLDHLRVNGITVSSDGHRFYSLASGVTLGTWNEAEPDKPQWRKAPENLRGGSFVPHPSDSIFASHNLIMMPSSLRVIAELDFDPKAFFREQPLVLGIGENDFLIASANDYRRLASVPLPLDWIRPKKARESNRNRVDFRQHLTVAEQLQTSFAAFAADDLRKLGMMILSHQLVVMSCAKAGVGVEPSLLVRNPLPQKLPAGQPFEVQLDVGATDVTFEAVSPEEAARNAVPPKGRPSKTRREDQRAAMERAAKQFTQLELAADVDANQTIVFVNDLSPLAGLPLPQTLRIGEETMKIVGVDDFKSALQIERTAGVRHSVSSPVVLVNETNDAPKPNLPSFDGRKLSWTPTLNQFGPQVLRLRAKAGQISHDWYWEVDVHQSHAELPFYVLGIEPERNSSRAVVWGQNSAPEPESRGVNDSGKKGPSKYFFGTYDRKNRQMIQTTEIAKPIMAATIHTSGIYVALDSRDPKALTSEAATQIVRFNSESLKVIEQVPIPVHVTRLQIIADKYLAGFSRWGVTVGLDIPALSPTKPPVPIGYKYPLAGRLRDGWVWDGVVWDEKMTKPRLLLYPVHFVYRTTNDEPHISIANLGAIHMSTEGPYVGTFADRDFVRGYQLTNHPGVLTCEAGELQYQSLANVSKPIIVVQRGSGGSSRPTAAVRLVDRPVRGQYENHERRITGYVSEDSGEVSVALLGKLYSVPLNQLVGEETAFRFVERQDQFVLQPGKPVNLTYSAPGATQYELRIWQNMPHFADEEPLVYAKSTDGKFSLAADVFNSILGSYGNESPPEIPPRMEPPQGKAGGAGRKGNEPNPTVLAFERLVGRKPKGMPIPIFVAVVAYHEDGQQKAGLAHSYLIELPAPKQR